MPPLLQKFLPTQPVQAHHFLLGTAPHHQHPTQVSPCTQSPKQPPWPPSIFAPCPLPGSGRPTPSHLLLCSRSFLRTFPEPHEGELHSRRPASCSSLHFTPTWTGCSSPVSPGNAASVSIAVSLATRALELIDCKCSRGKITGQPMNKLLDLHNKKIQKQGYSSQNLLLTFKPSKMGKRFGQICCQ